MPTALPEVFSLAYEPAGHLLAGRWLTEVSDEVLYPSYEQLLALAKAHGNCRFWLLDMRKRSWHSAEFADWFGKLLANKAVHELGSPVFVAYIAAEEHRQFIESVSTQATFKQAAQVEFYPHFFSDEASAREWLHYYQTHLQHTPPAPQA